MPSRRPLVAQLDEASTARLFAWVIDSGEFLFLSHAAGAQEENAARLATAERMLRGGLDSPALMKRYNAELLGQRWAGHVALDCPPGTSCLLWHVPSGNIGAGTDMPGRFAPIADARIGWNGPSLGSFAGLPNVAPQSNLLIVEVHAEPAWRVNISVPALAHEAVAPPLRQVLRRMQRVLANLAASPSR